MRYMLLIDCHFQNTMFKGLYCNSGCRLLMITVICKTLVPLTYTHMSVRHNLQGIPNIRAIHKCYLVTLCIGKGAKMHGDLLCFVHAITKYLLSI